MRDALKQEKRFLKTGEGESVDWDDVFQRQWEARAITEGQKLETAGKRR